MNPLHTALGLLIFTSLDGVSCLEEELCARQDGTSMLQGAISLQQQNLEPVGHQDSEKRGVKGHSEGVPKIPLNAYSQMTMVLKGITGVDIVLAGIACWVIFRGRTSLNVARHGFLGLETFQQAAIVVFAASLSVTHLFLQHRTGTTGYSIISATFLIYFGRFIVSFIMFLSKGDVKAGFATLFAPGCARFGQIPACLLPAVIGGLLAGCDALSFRSLHALDPVTYTIVLQMKIILVGVLWQISFRRTLTQTQWLALLLIAFAGITKGMDRAMVTETVRAIIPLTLLQATLGAISSVSSEVLLKEMPMPTDLYNTCVYLWGLVSIVSMMLFTEGPNFLYVELLSSAAWGRLWEDPWMIGSIIVMICFGIVTAYFLKHLSNIVAECCGGFVIVTGTGLEIFLGVSHISPACTLGIIIALLGICVYATDPLRTSSK